MGDGDLGGAICTAMANRIWSSVSPPHRPGTRSQGVLGSWLQLRRVSGAIPGPVAPLDSAVWVAGQCLNSPTDS